MFRLFSWSSENHGRKCLAISRSSIPLIKLFGKKGRTFDHTRKPSSFLPADYSTNKVQELPVVVVKGLVCLRQHLITVGYPYGFEVQEGSTIENSRNDSFVSQSISSITATNPLELQSFAPRGLTYDTLNT